MKISVIIPTHNRRQFLIEAIESVLKQTLLPDEILIINNGSEKFDLPTDICNKVKLFSIVLNAGASQARNFGASQAVGDYLAFLDDDDLWCNNYLANVNKAIGDGAECIISRLDKMQGRTISKYKNIENKLSIDKLLIFNPGINGSNIVVSRKLFHRVGGFDPKLITGEDKSLLIEILKVAKGKIEILPDNQAILRLHSKGNLSGAKTISEGIFQFVRKYKKIMNKTQYAYNVLKHYKKEYELGDKRIVAIYLYYKVLFSFLNLFTKQI